MLDAKTIAYVDPASGGTSGIHLAQALEKIGIADALKSKTHLVSPSAGQSSPLVGDIVKRGEAEIGIQPISEPMEVAGIDVVCSLPAELQSPDLVYVAGSSAASEQPVAAKGGTFGRTGLQGKWTALKTTGFSRVVSHCDLGIGGIGNGGTAGIFRRGFDRAGARSRHSPDHVDTESDRRRRNPSVAFSVTRLPADFCEQ